MRKGTKILLVEDSHFIAMFVGEYLRKNGYHIENVITGEEAIQKVCYGIPPDLILMDIELAGKINGIEAARIIIKHKEIPIIFLTANASEKVINEIRNVNAYGFLEKGMDNSALLATIEMALKLYVIKERIKEKESILNAVINSVRDAIIMVDKDGLVTLWNPASVELLGYSKEEMLGKDMNNIFPESIVHKKTEKTIEQQARHKNGSELELEVSISSLEINDEPYYVGILRDNSERKRVREELEKQSKTDFLTDAYNRRYFMERLEQEIERSKRTGRDFSLAMLDIDYFKSINDRFGHSIGDLVLKSIADIIKKRIRSIDCFARWGGEEFMILLTDTHFSKTYNLMENLKEGISNIKVPGIDTLTGSFGVVGYCKGDTADTLVHKVDSLMYEAKSSGRNCVRYMHESF